MAILRTEGRSRGAPAAGAGMALALRARLRGLARAAGLDVRRWDPASSAAARRRAVLERERIDIVLDAGAHVGQYVRQLRIGGYRGRVHSFEPLAGPYAELERRVAADDLWRCQRVALGDRDGTAEMNVAANEVSSSLLAVSDHHLDALAEAVSVGREMVRVARLDSIAAETLEAGDRAMLKLDLQGSELNALRGADETLAAVRVMEVELSFAQLYEGQPLAAEVMSELYGRGLRCVSLAPAFIDKRTGDVLQVDGLFVRDATE